MKTLVLVLAAHTSPYPFLIRTIKRTWASVEVASVDTLFYFGGSELGRAGRDLHLPVPDDLSHTGHKTLACFEHVLEFHNADLIFRTNCSSYVDLPNLKAFVQAHARPEGFYCGKIGMHGAVPFASGSGYFLSRDLVELAVRGRTEWDHSLLDDVALGALMRLHEVELAPAPRADYTSPADARSVDTTQFHFRCKTESRRRSDDARIMIAVHRSFCRARGARLWSPALLLTSLALRARAGAARARRRARRPAR